ncbi:MAG: hypothetical protein LBE12_20470, partial [Planctomycetaceae bacterium]|nr:hypothetical protein [Planctomycetaceae bacterium]
TISFSVGVAMRLLLGYFVLFLVLQNLAWCNETNIETSIKKIQAVCDLAVENRLKIKQWHVKLDCVNTGHLQDRFPTILSFYVDGQRKREEKTFPRPEGQNNNQTCTTISLLDGQSYYLYQKLDNLNEPTMPIYQAEQVGKYAPKDVFEMDFRVFGFTPYGFGIGNDPLRAYFCNLEQIKKIEKITMTDEILNGISCKKITYILKKGDAYVSFWLAVDCGYSPIRAETKTTSSKFYRCTSVDVSRYKDTDLWIPAHVIEEYAPTGDPYRKTEYTITVYSINESLDPKIFTLEGLNIPVGTPVDMHPDPKHLPRLWDGKKVVTEGEMLTNQMIAEKHN